MTFEESSYNKLSERDTLWRYLDFHKFIDLISNKTLHFTRLDQFDDPFEGITNKAIKDRYLFGSTPSEKDMLHLGKETAANIVSQAKVKSKEFEIAVKSQKSQFANCWVKLGRESMAMWDLYSNSNSVAIIINGKKFIDNVKSMVENQEKKLLNHFFIVGSVFYDKINPPDLFNNNKIPIEYNALKKDVCFSHEEEYRLVISSPTNMIDSNPKFHKIKLYDDFFKDIAIVCHPKMEEWKFKNIECLCNEFHLKPPQKSLIELNF